MEIKAYRLNQDQGESLPFRIIDSDTGKQATYHLQKGVWFFGLADVWDRWAEAGCVSGIPLAKFLASRSLSNLRQLLVELKPLLAPWPNAETLEGKMKIFLAEKIRKLEVLPPAPAVPPAPPPIVIDEIEDDAEPFPEVEAEGFEDEVDSFVDDALTDLEPEPEPAPEPEPEPADKPEVDPKLANAIAFTKKWLAKIGSKARDDALLDLVSFHGNEGLASIREDTFKVRVMEALLARGFDVDTLGADLAGKSGDMWINFAPDDDELPAEGLVDRAAEWTRDSLVADTRARDEAGHFHGDDPMTPENEAFKDGHGPRDVSIEEGMTEERLAVLQGLPSNTALGRKSKTKLMRIAKDLGIAPGSKTKAVLLQEIKELRAKYSG